MTAEVLEEPTIDTTSLAAWMDHEGLSGSRPAR